MPRSTAAPRAPLPDASTVIRACLAEVAPLFGDRVVLTSTAQYATTADGIRVRFTTAVARNEALDALRALGYAGRPDSRPIHEERGEALLVTGWDNHALVRRADRLERAVRELVAEHGQIAPKALRDYRDCIEYAHDTPAKAELQCVLSISAIPAARPIDIATASGTHHVTFPVENVDRLTAPEPTRGLLLRITAAETTLDKLNCVYSGTVQGAIHLYREYLRRPGYSERSARHAALREAAEANAAALQVATSDLEFHYLADLVLDRGTYKAAIQAQAFGKLDGPPVPLEERLTIMRYRNRATLDKFDICRHCLLGLRYKGADAAQWVDAWDEITCDSGRTHEPFPGAYQPAANPTA